MPLSAPLAAQVIAKVVAEDPAARAELLASFKAAPFRAALGDVGLPEDYLADRLGEAFVPYFETYAKEVGHPDAEAGLRFLLSEEPSAVETRRGLGRLLRSGSARSESWTYIFRDAALWQKHLENFLDERVAAKAASGDHTLKVKSVGAAYGAEPYTLAILTEAALERAGEDPKAWDVRIDAVAVSVGLLMGDASDSAARIALMERLIRAYAPKAGRGALPARAFTDPRFGAGSVVLEGTANEGARLKAVEFPDGPRLLWLVPGRLAPITDAYVDEKPPAPPRPPGAPRYGGITIRM